MAAIKSGDPSLSNKSFYFPSIILTTDRIANKEFDLAPVTVELEIFENITNPYLTGNLVFIDSNSILGGVDIIGGEKITVTIQSTKPGTFPIEKTFYIKAVNNAKRVNNSNEVISLSLIEDVAFISALHNVNKSYNGTCGEIISSIADSYLRKNISQVGEDFQRKFKVIIPNLAPLSAIQWIKRKATNSLGFPFYLYSTLVGDDLVFTDLTSLMDQNAMNTAAFGTDQSQANTGSSVVAQRRTVLSYDYSNNDDLHSLIAGGVVGSKHISIDTMTGRPKEFNFDVNADALLKYKAALTTKDLRMLPFDSEFKYNNESLSTYKSRTIAQVMSSGAYMTESYNKDLSYNQEDTAEGYKRKIVAESMWNFLLKSVSSWTINGFDFIDGYHNTSIGRVINLKVSSNTDGTNTEDAKQSGDHLIIANRHKFTTDGYYIAMSGAKLGSVK